MRDNLFRKQVFEAQQGASSQFGRPAATVPPAWSWFIYGLIIFFAALLLFAILVDFSRKETVRGLLRHTKAEARIISQQGGTVSEVFIQNGTDVKIGDPLFEIESETYLRDGRSFSSLALEQVDAEIRSVDERLEAAAESAGLVRRGLRQRKSSLEQRLVSTRSRKVALEQRYEVAEKRLAQARTFLEEGLIAQVDVDVREGEYNLIETELLALQREINIDETELNSVDVDIKQNDSSWARTRSELEQQILQLNGRKEETSSGAVQQIVASIDGVVTGLQVREGEPISQGRLVMAIVPDDSLLFAELFLPSRAIAFVKEGQKVKLQYDALPYQKFGIGHGTVRSVSTTAFLASDLDMAPQSDELLYRVEVDLSDQFMTAHGQPIPLQSGMGLSADIVLEERRVLDWALASFNRG